MHHLHCPQKGSLLSKSVEFNEPILPSGKINILFLHFKKFSALLKLWFRSLPRSIIPSHCIKEMENVVKASPDQKIDLIRETIISRVDGKSFLLWLFNQNSLASHLPLLKFLIGFLSKVAKEESSNKMGSPQLAIVFGPCLFWNNSV